VVRLKGAGQALRRLATLIPQEIEVLEATVRENLTFGEPCDGAALQVALHASCFADVVNGLPEGVETPLTERGFNLSGGQRQRLCLARGLRAARGSSLLLLDEPTSALDAATEARVLRNLSHAFPDACVIASLHRLSALEHFDTVILMEAGRIADAGPRHELLARQPQLRTSQAD
jgi:ATP-binding cassette, subfamily B, bacterial